MPEPRYGIPPRLIGLNGLNPTILVTGRDPLLSFLVLNRFGLAETWVVGALFSSFILFWSVVLFMGLVLAAVVVVGWRVLKVRCVTFRSDGGSRG